MPVSKNAYKRCLIIHNLLKKSPKVPKSKAGILEIPDEEGFPGSPSMLEKYIEAIRNTFCLPIRYHREPDAGGYYYSDPDVGFDIPMSDEAVKTIYGAVNQLALFQNTAAFRNARDSLEKIMSRQLQLPGLDPDHRMQQTCKIPYRSAVSPYFKTPSDLLARLFHLRA